MQTRIELEKSARARELRNSNREARSSSKKKPSLLRDAHWESTRAFVVTQFARDEASREKACVCRLPRILFFGKCLFSARRSLSGTRIKNCYPSKQLSPQCFMLRCAGSPQIDFGINSASPKKSYLRRKECLSPTGNWPIDNFDDLILYKFTSAFANF